MPQMVRKIGVVNVLRQGDAVLLGYQMKKQGWECPGGKVEEGETIEYACLRETDEETGNKIMKPSLKGFVDTGDEHLVPIYQSQPIEYVTMQREQPNPESHKFREWRWFHLSELPKDITWLSAQAIKIATGMEVTSHLPCPFGKKQKIPA